MATAFKSLQEVRIYYNCVLGQKAHQKRSRLFSGCFLVIEAHGGRCSNVFHSRVRIERCYQSDSLRCVSGAQGFCVYLKYPPYGMVKYFIRARHTS